MANGVDMMAAMNQGNADPGMKAAMSVLFHVYPWHAAACGDIDLTGYRKPQSYYRDILWNGGDRVYATVRLPEPDGKKIIATGWATYPTLSTWSWPGQEGKDLQVEVYSGAETWGEVTPWHVDLMGYGNGVRCPTGRTEYPRYPHGQLMPNEIGRAHV